MRFKVAVRGRVSTGESKASLPRGGHRRDIVRQGLHNEALPSRGSQPETSLAAARLWTSEGFPSRQRGLRRASGVEASRAIGAWTGNAV